MKNCRLLTIIVPTYNRSASLDVLLSEIAHQVLHMPDRIRVIVGDNCSTDDTPLVTGKFQARVPTARIVRHATNLGADENFCRCLELVGTKYFWIIGDDDLPKNGVLTKLVDLLDRESPDLVYLDSQWVAQVRSALQGGPVGTLRTVGRDRLDFANHVHIWCTFISGMIVNRETLRLALQGHTIRRFSGSNLVQLGWIFPVLAEGKRFFQVIDTCVLATKANTGGYALLTVFGVNFAVACREAFGARSHLTNALVRRAARDYLPALVWASRSASSGRFTAENPWPSMEKELGEQPIFRLLLYPLGHLPRPLAMALYQCWRAIRYYNKQFGRTSARLRCQIDEVTTSFKEWSHGQR